MSMPCFVAYYRVSTDRQGRSGLGLDAQRAAVAKYVAGAGGVVAAEFEEVESGKRNDRPQLAAALAACRARRAALVIAKLDRRARNARFLLHVVEGTGEAGVVFCDLPSVPPRPVGKFLLTQMAAVAELEAGLISQRTRAALAASKARGGPGSAILNSARARPSTRARPRRPRAHRPGLGLPTCCPTWRRHVAPGRAPCANWPKRSPTAACPRRLAAALGEPSKSGGCRLQEPGLCHRPAWMRHHDPLLDKQGWPWPQATTVLSLQQLTAQEARHGHPDRAEY